MIQIALPPVQAERPMLAVFQAMAALLRGANICLAVPLTLMAMTCTNLGNVGFQVFPGEYESVHIFLCTNKI